MMVFVKLCSSTADAAAALPMSAPCAAMVAMFPALVPAQTSSDTITPVSGPLLRGRITATAPGEITIEIQGRPRTITVNEIRSVRLGGEPAFLRQAREAIVNRQLDQAQEDLDRVNDAGLESMVAEELAYYRVYLAALQALESGKGAEDAEAAILQFVRAHPNNYHFFEAAEVLGDLAMQQNNFEFAGKYYAQLRKVALVVGQAAGNRARGGSAADPGR